MGNEADGLRKQLAKLPKEVVTHIVAFAGVRTCAILRHRPALLRLLATYPGSCYAFRELEGSVRDTLLGYKWNEGVQALVDAGFEFVLAPSEAKCWGGVIFTSQARTYPFFVPYVHVSHWDGIILAESTIKYLLLRDKATDVCAALVYNRIERGFACDDLAQWCSSRASYFLVRLGNELLRHGGSLDQLRVFCKQTGFYINERHLAEWFLAGAIKAGNLDIVRHCAALAPELAMEHIEPLRHAAEGGHLDIVQFLLEGSPQLSNRMAIGDALQQNHIEVATWLYDYRPTPLRSPMVEPLAFWGHLELLQKLWKGGHAQGELWDDPPELVQWSIRGNQLHVLEWLGQVQPGSCKITDVYSGMASCMQDVSLDTLRWVVEHASDEPTAELFLPQCRSPDAIKSAIGAGHVGLARFLAKKLDLTGEVDRIKAEAVKWARRSDWTRIVPYLGDHIDCKCQACDVPNSLVSDGNLDALEMVLSFHPHMRIYPQYLHSLPEYGNLPLIQWLYDYLAPADRSSKAFDAAAKYGKLSIVQWFHVHTDLKCTTAAMDQAAECGWLDVVQYLHEHRSEGCTVAAMDGAAASGHLDVLEWLHEHRNEGCTQSAMTKAAENGALDVVKWLHQHYPHTLTPSALDKAAYQGHLAVVLYLHSVCAAPCTVAAMDNAAFIGDLSLVRWLHENRTEGYAQAMPWAMRRGHTAIVRYLESIDPATTPGDGSL
ncbi:hypothetical protein RI367_003381 [Sorochytrium milnesiophthora]